MTNSLETESRPVVIFDSGVGGLPYLELAARELKTEYFYYVADTAHFPYGDKREARIRQIVPEVIGRLIRKFAPKCVVVACNTASVTSLADLRMRFSLPFIGVVPAVKPAAEGSRAKRICVLATLRTVEDGYLGRLIDAFAGACEVTIHPAGGLRDIVEERFFSSSREEKLAAIREALAPLMPRMFDALVLGCTHFIHLEAEFREVLGEEIQLIDSRRGVIRQLGRVLAQQELLAAARGREDRFYLTGIPAAGLERYRLFAEKYGLVFKGVW